MSITQCLIGSAIGIAFALVLYGLIVGIVRCVRKSEAEKNHHYDGV